MKETAFVSHYDCSRHDTGWKHPEHQGRLPALMRAVYADMLTLFDVLLEVEGRHASAEELRIVHSEAYLERVEGWAAEARRLEEVIEPVPDLRVSGASLDAARAAVGCTLAAVDKVLDGEVRRAFCAVRPPGRYVTRNEAGGFGILNTVVTCARYLGHRLGVGGDEAVRKVFVLELCGPAGSPSARLMEDQDALVGGVYLAVEGERAGSNERHLASGVGAPAFLNALEQVLEVAAGERFSGMVLSIGFDGLAGDPLGDLGLRPEDYHATTLRVRRFAEEWCGGRMVSILEGGYETRGLGIATVQHLRALAGVAPIG